ncbi:hypothetical protein OSTOST_25548, partial [Ostertagia ostertagi]
MADRTASTILRVTELKRNASNRHMGPLFNVSCATLAALATIRDDTTVRWVTLTLPQGSLVRYISETAFLDDAPATPADIHEILKFLGSQFDSALAYQNACCARVSAEAAPCMSNTLGIPSGRCICLKKRSRSTSFAEKEVSECLRKSHAGRQKMSDGDNATTRGNGNKARAVEIPAGKPRVASSVRTAPPVPSSMTSCPGSVKM